MFLLLCSVASNNLVKIGDFGHAKEDYFEVYHSAPTQRPQSLEEDEEKCPFRWQAPESMTERKFSTRSDVVCHPTYCCMPLTSDGVR